MTSILLLSFIFLQVTTALSQGTPKEENQIITELEKKGGKLDMFDFFEEGITAPSNLYKVTAECTGLDTKVMELHQPLRNETNFVWACRDIKTERMYLIVTNKELKEASCTEQTYRDISLAYSR